MFILIPIAVLGWALWLWFGKRMVKPRRAATLATAIPPTLLAIAGIVFGLLDPHLNPLNIDNPAGSCLIVGALLVAAVFLSSVVFAIIRKWEIAKGTALGSVINLVVWVIVYYIVVAWYWMYHY